MMYLARELKMTLSDLLEKMSTLELRLWAAYLNLEHKTQNRNLKNGQLRRHNR